MTDAQATDAIDATAVEEPATHEPTNTDVARHTATLAVTPQVEAAELVARLNVIRQAMNSAMTDGIDYGRIPGIDKPSLFKPGSEKLGVLFQLDIQLVNEKTWGPGEHLTVISHATVYHAPTGSRLGYGEGLCTTREKKYGKRKAERVCPACGKPAIIKGKAEYGGGWLCWKKKDGCDAKFSDNDQAIVGQEVGDVENPELPDTWNTVIKMAEKRARVDAVLAVTGASALFTQDAEDAPRTADAATTEAAVVVPDWGGPASDDLTQSLRKALAYLLNDAPDGDRVNVVGSGLLLDADGVVTKVAARAIIRAVTARRELDGAKRDSGPAPANALLGDDIEDAA